MRDLCRWTRCVFAVVIALLISGCQPAVSRDEASPELEKLLGGRAGIDCILKSQAIRAYRVTPVPGDFETLSEYNMVSGPVELAAAQADRLRTVVFDDKTYLWDVAKACGEPVYGVRFECSIDDHRIDLMICFSCDYLGVYLDGRRVDFEDCDGGRSALVQVVQATFPNDPEIQSLKSSTNN